MCLFLNCIPTILLSKVVGQAYGYFQVPAAAPEPRPARPVQIGGASSSSGPAGERQPRAVETDPRDPYRKFPNDQRVRFGDNPGRSGAPRWVRFEKYKAATSIGGATRLVATSQDISMDVVAGALGLL